MKITENGERDINRGEKKYKNLNNIKHKGSIQQKESNVETKKYKQNKRSKCNN